MFFLVFLFVLKIFTYSSSNGDKISPPSFNNQFIILLVMPWGVAPLFFGTSARDLLSSKSNKCSSLHFFLTFYFCVCYRNRKEVELILR